MKQQRFLSISLTALKGLFLLLFLLAVSLASRPLAANGPTGEYQVYLPIVSTPAELDEPTVGYATGTDRTLIRWFCTSSCDTEFEVYRRASGGTYQLLGTTGRESNAAAAILTLNTTDNRWPSLYADLLDEYEEQNVTGIASLYAMLDENMLVAQKLANEYYPVALINGWGYLDTNFTAGTNYSYRVVRASDGEIIGEVTLIAGQLTPLPAPENVQALELDPEESELTHAKAADWGQVQADRRFHQNAYLRWDVGEPSATGYPAAWTIGYDIYRAAADTPNALSQVNGEISVQPIAASEPDIVASEVILAGAAEQDYQMIEHFYADPTSDPGGYVYRVAPRDALGQIRQWPAHSAQFSAAVPVTTYDFLPPLPPQNPQATINTNHTQVTLSWEMPDPPADLAGFRIERTLSFSNTIPAAECVDDAVCWAEVATVGTNTFQWLDNDPQLEQARWYRLQAVDESGNRSMYTMPVHATLHDIDPPGPPLLSEYPCSPTPSDPTPDYCLEAEGDDDIVRYLVGCTFEMGTAEIYFVEVAAGENGDMPALTVTDLYQPPFPLFDVACTVRGVDEMGNISDPSAPVIIDEWTTEEPSDLPDPIIANITTVALDGQGNATSLVKWEMPDSPLISFFRIDRETLSGDDSNPMTFNVNPSARTYEDDELRAGELYSYTVTAELKFGLGERISEPHFYRALSNGRRPLVLFELTQLDWNANAGTILAWDSCEDGAPVDGIRHYAVFRSVGLDEGYNQITPIFPATICNASYIDSSAQHGRYFYSIMEFDGRTGEPIGYTIPVQFDTDTTPQAGGYIAVPQGQGLVQSTYTALIRRFSSPTAPPSTRPATTSTSRLSLAMALRCIT